MAETHKAAVDRRTERKSTMLAWLDSKIPRATELASEALKEDTISKADVEMGGVDMEPNAADVLPKVELATDSNA